MLYTWAIFLIFFSFSFTINNQQTIGSKLGLEPMPTQITVFGQHIALEALLLVCLSIVVLGFVIRELFYLFFVKSLYIWSGFIIALGGFGLATLKSPSDISVRMRVQKKSFRQTFKQYAFTRSENWHEELIALTNDKPLPFSVYPDSFLVSDSLDKLIEYVIRDFVLSWYRSFASDTLFPSQVDHALRIAFSQIISRSMQINWADLIVTKMVPVISEHFRKFTAADSAVREKSIGRNLTDNNEFQYAVALQYSQGRLHPALLPLKHYQYDAYRKNWLRGLTEKLIPILLGEAATNNVVNHLARDIIGCSVLFPSLTMLSDPDFWNQLLVNTAGPTLQDHKKVEQLRKALNEHATLGRNSGFKSVSSASESASLILTPNADQGDYDKFIKDIQKCNSIAEARQIRYYISVQLQRTSKDKANSVYVRRLGYAKRIVDKRIAKLTGTKVGAESVSNINSQYPPSGSVHGGLLNHDPRRDYDLSQILNDPAFCLSFMEYMDLLKRTMLVQFWLTMNSLRNPLEEEADEDDDDDNDNLNDSYDPLSSNDTNDPSNEIISKNNKTINSTNQNNSTTSGTNISIGNNSIDDKKTIHNIGSLINENDIYQIYDTYFNGKMPGVSKEAQAAIQRFIEAPKKTPESIAQARKALVLTQNAVFKIMQETDLVKFKKSDLFLNFLASERKPSLAKNSSQAESTIDSLQMDSISDYEGPPTTQPDEKDVEDIEKVFDSIMGDKSSGIGGLGSRSNASNSVDNLTKPGHRLNGLIDEKKNKRSTTSGPTPLFDDSDGELFSDMDTGDELGFENEDQLPISELHLAAPGDLGLTEAINMLSKQIKVLYRQEQVLEPLLRKAELTNNVGNLRVLRKSKASLEREIQRKELQRQQYIVQESDNSLYGRSNIQIRSYMTAQDSNGPFILYVIEVERLASDGNISAGWVVARRYSQFFQLHQLLRSMFTEVRKLPFPKKRVVLKFQQKSFADARRIALQRYLRDLLQMPAVCRSKAFRMFLSSETFSIDSVKNSVANTSKEGAAAAALAATAGKLESSLYVDDDISDGDDDSYADAETGGAGLSGSGFETGGVGGNSSGIMGGPVSSSDYASMAIEAESEMDDPSNKPFIQPICDLFIQIFGFDRGNNWVRGRAVVVVVQQILGGTIERRLRDAISGGLATEQNVTDGLQKLFDSMWPQGASFMETQAAKQAIPERTGAEKMKCKYEARVIVYTLIRDACVKIVGSTSSKYAAYHLFEMLQNEKLNAHLIYSLLDVLIDEIFPDSI